MDTDDLAARLQLAEDRLAIMELEGAYAEAFDGRRGDAWAALFTEDGSYEGRLRPGIDPQPAADVHGREALARFCEDSPFTGIHLMNLPRLTLAGDEATSRIHFTFHLIEGLGTPAAHVGRTIGYYDVAYVRTTDGWRIRRRVTTPFARDRLTALGYEATGAFEAG